MKPTPGEFWCLVGRAFGHFAFCLAMLPMVLLSVEIALEMSFRSKELMHDLHEFSSRLNRHREGPP